MPNPVPARYHDAKGVEHEVIARKAREGAWQVLDVSARGVHAGREPDRRRRGTAGGRGDRAGVRARPERQGKRQRITTRAGRRQARRRQRRR